MKLILALTIILILLSSCQINTGKDQSQTTQNQPSTTQNPTQTNSQNKSQHLTQNQSQTIQNQPQPTQPNQFQTITKDHSNSTPTKPNPNQSQPTQSQPTPTQLTQDQLKTMSIDYIKNISEFQRNNGSNLTFVRSNQLSGGGWNVVYEYDVNTNLLPDFIKRQQVHLLIENETVKKYMIAEVSTNVVNK